MDPEKASWFEQNAGALIAVAGTVMGAVVGGYFGARATTRAARTASLSAHNLYWLPLQFNYIADVSNSAVEQYAMYGKALQDRQDWRPSSGNNSSQAPAKEERYERSPELIARIAQSTSAWRGLMGQRILYADARVAAEMSNYDECRALTVNALNRDDLPGADAAIALLRGSAFDTLQLSLNILRNEHSPLLVAPLGSRRQSKRARREAKKHNAPLLEKYRTLAPGRASELDGAGA